MICGNSTMIWNHFEYYLMISHQLDKNSFYKKNLLKQYFTVRQCLVILVKRHVKFKIKPYQALNGPELHLRLCFVFSSLR